MQSSKLPRVQKTQRTCRQVNKVLRFQEEEAEFPLNQFLKRMPRAMSKKLCLKIIKPWMLWARRSPKMYCSLISMKRNVQIFSMQCSPFYSRQRKLLFDKVPIQILIKIFYQIIIFFSSGFWEFHPTFSFNIIFLLAQMQLLVIISIT